MCFHSIIVIFVQIAASALRAFIAYSYALSALAAAFEKITAAGLTGAAFLVLASVDTIVIGASAIRRCQFELAMQLDFLRDGGRALAKIPGYLGFAFTILETMLNELSVFKGQMCSFHDYLRFRLGTLFWRIIQ